MYRIDTVDAQATLPTPTAPGPQPNAYWYGGDPSSGTPGTVVPEEWMNMVQEEMCKVAEGMD